ncbi:MAG TPA: hypothetical protein VGF97_00210 [Rhizomicrobium sp.]|jgi:hypothetical protein
MSTKRKAAGSKIPARKAKARAVKKRPAAKRCAKTVEQFDWQGITVSVSYEPDWRGMDATAHLEIQLIAPDWQVLPITETGYRSHFLPRGIVEEEGGAGCIRQGVA